MGGGGTCFLPRLHLPFVFFHCEFPGDAVRMRYMLHLLQNPLGGWSQAFLQELALQALVGFSIRAFKVHQDFQGWLAQISIAGLAEVCPVGLSQQAVYLVLVLFITPFVVSAFRVSWNTDVRQSTFFVQASGSPQFIEHFADCFGSLHLPEHLGMLLVAFVQVASNQLLLVLFSKFSIFDFLLLGFNQLLAFLFVCFFAVLQSQGQLIICAARLVSGCLNHFGHVIGALVLCDGLSKQLAHIAHLCNLRGEGGPWTLGALLPGMLC